MCNDSATLSFDISSWFIASKVSQLILAPIALILNLSLIFALVNLKSIHLHNNLRYLLANVSACSSLASVYAFVKSIVAMVIWLVGSKCNLVETFLTCKLHDGIFLFAKLPVLFTLVVSGMERFYAVRHFQTYAVMDDSNGDRKSSSAAVPVAAICSVWSLSLGLVVFLTLTAAYNNEYKIAYCSVLFVYDVNVVNITASVLLLVELCSLVFYMGMWCHTIKKLTISVDDVSDNYQLNDRLARKTTLTVSRFMLYSIFVHAACWTTILVTILLIVNNSINAAEYLIIGDYLFYTLCILHMIIHPILSVYNCEIVCLEMAKIYPFLKPLSKKLLEKETRKAPVVVHFSNHDEHFGRMNTMWENKKSKLKS